MTFNKQYSRNKPFEIFFFLPSVCMELLIQNETIWNQPTTSGHECEATNMSNKSMQMLNIKVNIWEL